MNKWSNIPIRFWKTTSIGLLIIVLCLFPSSEIAKLHVRINHVDVIAHMVMFMVFAAFLFHDLCKYSTEHNIKRLSVVITLIVCFLLGVMTEILQYMLTFLNRSGNVIDFVFDLIGTLIGISGVYFIKRKPDAES